MIDMMLIINIQLIKKMIYIIYILNLVLKLSFGISNKARFFNTYSNHFGQYFHLVREKLIFNYILTIIMFNL